MWVVFIALVCVSRVQELHAGKRKQFATRASTNRCSEGASLCSVSGRRFPNLDRNIYPHEFIEQVGTNAGSATASLSARSVEFADASEVAPGFLDDLRDRTKANELSHLLKRLMKRTEFEHVAGWHLHRHHFASLLVADGATPQEGAAMIVHRSTTMFQTTLTNRVKNETT